MYNITISNKEHNKLKVEVSEKLTHVTHLIKTSVLCTFDLSNFHDAVIKAHNAHISYHKETVRNAKGGEDYIGNHFHIKRLNITLSDMQIIPLE